MQNEDSSGRNRVCGTCDRVCLSEHGHEVTCVDVDENKVK